METYFCTCCGRKLNPATLVFLELDQRINRYTDQPVPEEHSQGCFEFGPACAKKEAKAARLAAGALK